MLSPLYRVVLHINFGLKSRSQFTPKAQASQNHENVRQGMSSRTTPIPALLAMLRNLLIMASKLSVHYGSLSKIKVFFGTYSKRLAPFFSFHFFFATPHMYAKAENFTQNRLFGKPFLRNTLFFSKSIPYQLSPKPFLSYPVPYRKPPNLKKNLISSYKLNYLPRHSPSIDTHNQDMNSPPI